MHKTRKIKSWLSRSRTKRPFPTWKTETSSWQSSLGSWSDFLPNLSLWVLLSRISRFWRRWDTLCSMNNTLSSQTLQKPSTQSSRVPESRRPLTDQTSLSTGSKKVRKIKSNLTNFSEKWGKFSSTPSEGCLSNCSMRFSASVSRIALDRNKISRMRLFRMRSLLTFLWTISQIWWTLWGS